MRVYALSMRTDEGARIRRMKVDYELRSNGKQTLLTSSFIESLCGAAHTLPQESLASSWTPFALSSWSFRLPQKSAELVRYDLLRCRFLSSSPYAEQTIRYSIFNTQHSLDSSRHFRSFQMNFALYRFIEQHRRSLISFVFSPFNHHSILYRDRNSCTLSDLSHV